MMRYLFVLFTVTVSVTSCFAQAAVKPATKYAAAVTELQSLIQHEVADKRLPALSIALVDDQHVVWATGYGFQDKAKKIPATTETVYRVGSVSKLFTDIAIMQLVEEGKLDLDAPLTNYLPDFKPAMKADHKPITLRMLTAHHSGLVREPPVGNYFDPTEPGLEKTVASLNGVDLVFAPGERVKYSNGAIALVGYTLQKTQKEKFEPYVQRRVLDKLGMTNTSFEATPAVKKLLADAVMGTYHGREFPAPTFELGEAPAGCMYSTVMDLGKFLSCLFAGGQVNGQPLLKPESLAEMFKPQFSKPEDPRKFGIGFALGEVDGVKRIGHGGAIYGFATELAALPSEKLGVVVVCSRDVANSVVTRIADDALRLMLAAKAGKPLPALAKSQPFTLEETRALAGRYRNGERFLDLTELAGKAYLTGDRGGYRIQVQKSGADIISDDILSWGAKFTRDGDKLTRNKLTYTKEKPTEQPPTAPPAKWDGLIGEYGWDHNTLYILERNGKLYALIEWIFLDQLTELENDVFQFPDGGLYIGEKLIFTRDKSGRATKVEAAKVVFDRRKVDGENGETFRVQSVRPIDGVRKDALAAKPPVEMGDFLKPDLVDLATIDPAIKFDIRYATENNFLSVPFYTSAKAFLQRPAATALGRVHAKLQPLGYGLLIYDAYRPWHVTKMFREATPTKFHSFVADPEKGSRHNRGCAVDLGLYDLKTGAVVPMVSGYDEFSDRAFPEYPGGTSRQRWHRDLLRRLMQDERFEVYEEEWWHFDFHTWKKYPILNQTFEELK